MPVESVNYFRNLQVIAPTGYAFSVGNRDNFGRVVNGGLANLLRLVDQVRARHCGKLCKSVQKPRKRVTRDEPNPTRGAAPIAPNSNSEARDFVGIP